MGLAIFIVPKGELRLKIVRWKKKVQRHIDGQPTHGSSSSFNNNSFKY